MQACRYKFTNHHKNFIFQAITPESPVQIELATINARPGFAHVYATWPEKNVFTLAFAAQYRYARRMFSTTRFGLPTRVPKQ